MTNTPNTDVLCIGNAIVDILARVDDAFIEKQGCIKGAMNLVDECQSEALYQAVPPAIEQSGGSAGNTAVGIASLGGSVSYIGKVRDDQLGKVFRHDIKASGVAFSTKSSVTGAATATSIVLITPDAQRTMNTYLGACGDLTVDDIDQATVADAKVTYVEGYLWDREAAKDAVSKAIDLAHISNREVAFTLSDSFCVDRFRDEFRALIKEKLDIVFANEAEILSLYQVDRLEAALDLIATEVNTAAVTLSERGAVIISGNDRIWVPAIATEVEDTTGAGDLFAAGFLYGYTAGKDLETCGKLGVLAASEVISHIGPRPAQSLKDLAIETLGPTAL